MQLRQWPPCIALLLVGVTPACQRGAASSGGFLPLDTAPVLAELSRDHADTFRILAVATYTFDSLPVQIAVLHVLGRHTERNVGLAQIRDGSARKFYDAGYPSGDCGEDQQGPSSGTLLEVAKRPLFVLEESRVGILCVGQNTREVVTATFFDVLGGFKRVLALEESSVNHGDYEDSAQAPPTFRHTYFFPNGCGGASGCDYLSVFTASSDPRFKQPYFAYAWNADTTALVGRR